MTDIPLYYSVGGMAAASVPADAHVIYVSGVAEAEDGKGGYFSDDISLGPPSFTSLDGRNWCHFRDVNTDRLCADVAVRLIEFDIRDSRFAGGAKWNDIDNDDTAFSSAIAYFKTLGGINKYQGANAARLRLPRGMGRIGVDSVNLTGASNVRIAGEGDGISNVRLTGNFPAFKTTTVAGNNESRIGLEDFCIYGPGRQYENAHGIDFGALNHGLIRNIHVYRTRDILRLRNNWQTEIISLKGDGGPVTGGGLTSYRGICLLDGLDENGNSSSVIENAVKIYGGVISGCEKVGFRGESVSGSMVMGLEVLGCGEAGVLIGDNPGGKPTKWFTWTGGMIDTNADCLVLKKGNSSELTEMHFDAMWIGYANAGGGAGEGIRIEDGTGIEFSPRMIANVDTALLAKNCIGIVFDAGVIRGYDRSLLGKAAITLENVVQSSFSVGRGTRWQGSPATHFLVETGASDYNVFNGINADNTMIILDNDSVVNACRPFKARAYGTADILAGQSSVVVPHGLGRKPRRGEIQVTPRHSLSSVGAADFRVEVLTSSATTFTIRTNAAVTSGIGFDWFGDVSRG
ncbi:hypothetical protein DXT97_12340 [Agrobacterium tumefaciens]|uniref:hypothetical protein n=1 Tax=Agrobacterium tumefaciens TaxID=358 RepID=UPI001295A09D|nr:hypothetical protein [Agrobacterium tumefaciens]MQB37580.1 hypothetical protein [Agrobacterium tumefaciens]